jgi:hypothetical protein
VTRPLETAAIGRRRPRPPVQWYQASLERLARTIFRPGGAHVTTLLFYAGALSGVVLALYSRGRSPVIPVLAFVAAVAVAIAVSALYRWTWPWQRAYVREGRRSEALLTSIVGVPIERGAAEAWLERSAGAPAIDRMLVLRWLGRNDDADGLIPVLATATPLDRYRRASAEAFHVWRTAGHLAIEPVLELVSGLEPVERERAEATLAFWWGVAAVADGRDLRNVPPPKGGRLSPGDEVRLWHQRLWPLRWMAVLFLATWLGLDLLALVVPSSSL